MRRFYFDTPNLLKIGDTIAMTDNIFHHWCKVLRANVGDTAIFFDGQGGEYSITICQIDKKTAQVTITDFNPVNRSLPFGVTIALVMSRGERMDYAIQKACETGVSTIQLLTSHHGEVRLKPDQIAKKLEHWQSVANAACEQCGLNIIPQILAPIGIDDFIKNFDEPNTTKIVLAVPERLSSEQIFGFNKFDKNKNYCLLIGAEGGLSDEELNLAYQHHFLAWQIGERILRTETAPVVALTALQTLYTVTYEHI